MGDGHSQHQQVSLIAGQQLHGPLAAVTAGPVAEHQGRLVGIGDQAIAVELSHPVEQGCIAAEGCRREEGDVAVAKADAMGGDPGLAGRIGKHHQHALAGLAVPAAVVGEGSGLVGPVQAQFRQFPFAEVIEAIGREAADNATHESAGEVAEVKAIAEATKEQGKAGTEGTADPAIGLQLPAPLLQLGLHQLIFIEAAKQQPLHLNHGLGIGIAAAIHGLAGGQTAADQRHEFGRSHQNAEDSKSFRSASHQLIRQAAQSPLIGRQSPTSCQAAQK